MSPSDPNARRRPGDRSTWTEGVHGKLDLLRVAIDENTKATLAMAGRINMFFLVPLAICAMSAATWALYVGKISEHSWLGVMLGCLAQFFGEGVKKIIEGIFPWSRKAPDAKTLIVMMGLGVGSVLFFSGLAHR